MELVEAIPCSNEEPLKASNHNIFDALFHRLPQSWPLVMVFQHVIRRSFNAP